MDSVNRRSVGSDKEKMIYLQLFLAFLRVGFFSFGGGMAALPLIEKEVVDTYQWLSNGEFLELVALSELTPGPIGINCATFTGFKVIGIWGSLVATSAFCLPSILLVTLVFHSLSHFEENIWVQRFLRGLRPVVIALIGIAAYSLAQKGIKDWFAVGLGMIVFIFVYRKKTNPILFLLLSGVAGLIWYGA
ncbi:MAG: chromate transporter [Candidatus Atribacteria bacterium]|nr:chromate transporter [Candidatus Atribacteria bacterium]